MNVGRSVTKAIEDWEAGDFDGAMLHACNAIDGTARKRATYSALGNRERFCRALRDDLEILGSFGMPGIDLQRTRFPVSLPRGPAGFLDIADVLYKVHRCTHGHGDELPRGFELIADAAGPPSLTRFEWNENKLMLSDRMIFAMVAICIVSAENADQKTKDGYSLAFGGTTLMPINEWWGRRSALLEVVRSVELPSVHLDFSSVKDNLMGTAANKP